MEIRIEKDPSGRATCNNLGCGKIPIGEMRMTLEFKGPGITRSEKYCKKCAIELLNNLLKELNMDRTKCSIYKNG